MHCYAGRHHNKSYDLCTDRPTRYLLLFYHHVAHVWLSKLQACPTYVLLPYRQNRPIVLASRLLISRRRFAISRSTCKLQWLSSWESLSSVSSVFCLGWWQHRGLHVGYFPHTERHGIYFIFTDLEQEVREFSDIKSNINRMKRIHERQREQLPLFIGVRFLSMDWIQDLMKP